MTGGDRMILNGYARTYARFLDSFGPDAELVLAEFGVLKGSGLAIWCDRFPKARIVGLDIDLAHFEGNRKALERLGAFAQNVPELHEYDQLVDGGAAMGRILGGRTLDVVIDDGLHSVEAIATTFKSVAPHLSRRFVYFIEDHAGLAEKCGALFAGFDVCAEGAMTVVSRGFGGPKP